ncbi:MAG: cobalt-precorrin 5A hydrolase [Thermoanaerobacteraceae bacterium]|nr:cobalt-precorrin 5A hydrolase [Thermoanaerobacteraceae bacterium]
MKYAVVALTEGGSRLAVKVADLVKYCDVYIYRGNAYPGLQRRQFTEFNSLGDLLGEIMPRYQVIVLIMALGIVMRTIGPYLQGKDRDPAVLVLDERGQFVISALSGHLGGANELAVGLAAKLGARPVITTATDVRGITAVDSLTRSLGWKLEPVAGIRRVNSALANGRDITVVSDLDYLPGRQFGSHEILRLQPAQPGGKKPVVVVSNKTGQQLDWALYVRPNNLIIGLGCKKAISLEELLAAVSQTLNRYQLSAKCVKEIATCTVKKGEAGLTRLAEQLQVPVKYYTPEELSGAVREFALSRSTFVKKQIGVEGVCEPAAMLGAKNPRLIVPKTTYPGITVAVAEDTSILSA